MLDSRVETFLCVCQYMNYTKAAQKLHITQPAVSVQIRQLEEQYGVKIFCYEGRRMEMTVEGKILYQAMATMKHDEQYLKERLREQLQDREGRVKQMRFGATKTIGEFLLPDILSRYLSRRKDTVLHMEVANTGELLRELDEGRLDFALVEGYFDKNSYGYEVFSEERFLAVTGKQEFSETGECSMEELFSLPLVVREEGSGSREILERMLAQKNFHIEDFDRVHEMNSIQLIKSLVKAGHGITFLYEMAVHGELNRGELFAVPMKEPDFYHEFNFVWRKNSIFKQDYLQVKEEFLRLQAMNCT